MRRLKILAGIALITSLFLPFSTCSVIKPGEQESQQAKEIRHVVSKNSSLEEWLWAITFLLPCGFALYTDKEVKKIQREVVSIISTLPPAFLIYTHSMTGTLAVGGYIATLSILIYILTSIYLVVRVNT